RRVGDAVSVRPSAHRHPAKAGAHASANAGSERWVPAFAGTGTRWERWRIRRNWACGRSDRPPIVAPATVGPHFSRITLVEAWIPGFAGMTRKRAIPDLASGWCGRSGMQGTRHPGRFGIRWRAAGDAPAPGCLMQRRLTTILAADVVGYSRLM